MLEMLIGSKARVKLLTLFCLNPGKRFFIREIVRKCDIAYLSVVRELKILEEFGLLQSEVSGKQKYYWVDEQFFLYEDLQKLVIKTEGIDNTLREDFSKLKDIDFLFVYGSFASGKADPKSDLDLFIVGDLMYEDVIEILGKDEKKLGRPINYTIFRLEDLISRIQNQDSFILNVLENPKIMLIGEEDELKSLGREQTDKEE